MGCDDDGAVRREQATARVEKGAKYRFGVGGV
jgi:hypothetical protein